MDQWRGFDLDSHVHDEHDSEMRDEDRTGAAGLGDGGFGDQDDMNAPLSGMRSATPVMQMTKTKSMTTYHSRTTTPCPK
eukprot:m.129851 g.129851  ORF g.129851 m.129851 type:complete len:79 (+) comp9774_c0_seq9:1188-1424(+)